MRSRPPTPPTVTSEPPTAEARLSVVRDIFVAPGRAFATLLTSPSWIVAYALVLLASVASMFLTQNATAHLTALRDPAIGAHPTPSQLATILRENLAYDGVFNLLAPILFWGTTASVLSTVSRFRGRPVSFRTIFALAANCSLPSAIGSLVTALAIASRAPDAFGSVRAFMTAVPDNLAAFAAPNQAAEAAFLANFGIFDLWSSLLLAYGFVAFAQVRLTTALVLSLGLDLIFALLFAS